MWHIRSYSHGWRRVAKIRLSILLNRGCDDCPAEIVLNRKNWSARIMFGSASVSSIRLLFHITAHHYTELNFAHVTFGILFRKPSVESAHCKREWVNLDAGHWEGRNFSERIRAYRICPSTCVIVPGNWPNISAIVKDQIKSVIRERSQNFENSKRKRSQNINTFTELFAE